MRIHGHKALRAYMERAAIARAETRNAVLWEVLPAQRVARVKIQGANTLITAYYPENWERTPSWLKPGNSVRVLHTGGNRGRIELTGHAQVVPTPVSGATFPTVSPGSDAALNGCAVTQIFNNPKMAVQVHAGTLRIGGTAYVLGPISMLNGDNFVMGDGGAMGDIAGVVPINASPAAGQFRFDLLSVGADLAIDYTPGSASATPEKPTPGASHVALAYVLVAGGDTRILQANIAQDFLAPRGSMLTITFADDELAWGEMTTTVTLTLLDQYGHPFTSGNLNYFTLEILAGNGTVHSSEDGDSTTRVGQHTLGASYVFDYARDGLDPGDSSPLLQGTVQLESDLSNVAFLKLLNAAGDLMR